MWNAIRTSTSLQHSNVQRKVRGEAAGTERKKRDWQERVWWSPASRRSQRQERSDNQAVMLLSYSSLVPFPSSSSVLHLFPLISAVPLETDCSSRQPLRLLVFSCCCQFIKSKISPLEFQLSGFKVSGSVAELVIKKAVCSRVRGHRGLSMSTGEKSGSAGEQHHDRLDSKPWGSI